MLPLAEAVRIVPARPVDVVTAFLLACVVRVLRTLRLPARWALATPAVRALAEADVAVDVGGISFVDGRGIVLLAYNAMLPGIPLLLGTPTIKASQAIGPARTPLNRLLARFVLRRLVHVHARGERTLAHLSELCVEQASLAADLAFTLDLPDDARRAAAPWLDGEVPTVTIVPSRVLQEHCDGTGVDYVGLLAAFCDRLTDRGLRVLIVPHAARSGAPASRMNDLPVSRAVHARTTRRDRVALVEDELSPHVLRAIIGGSAVVVTARFHAMISALATCTPVVVTGWSHKYREVLRAFDLEDTAIGFEELSLEALTERFDHVYEQRGDLGRRIATHLPAVLDSARRNFDTVTSVLHR
jgi:polysaccharide pyruvyl transferase WcaK-like protein